MRALLTGIIALAGYAPLTEQFVKTPLYLSLVKLQADNPASAAVTGANFIWLGVVFLFAWSAASFVLQVLDAATYTQSRTSCAASECSDSASISWGRDASVPGKETTSSVGLGKSVLHKTPVNAQTAPAPSPDSNSEKAPL